MPPRFYASPYKNALVQVGKRDTWYTELPVTTSALTDSSDLVKTCSEYWLAQGNASGSLVCSPYEQPGKFGNKAPGLVQVSSRAITDFDVSFFEDLLVAGSDNGQITVQKLPSLSELQSSTGAFTPKTVFTATHPAAKAISTLSFHPTTQGLLLAAAGSVVAIYDALSGSSAPVFTLENGTNGQIWSAQWSVDGKLVSVTGKDGMLRLWDVRTDASKPAMEIASHPGLKPSRHTHLSATQIFTTGFSRMREREYSLVDIKLGKVIKTQRVDTGMGVLMPVANKERSIVYLAGRGDQTLRAIIVDSAISTAAPFTESTTALPLPVFALALAPPNVLNLMKAEINRLILLTGDGVIEAPVEVPRRQYIDFHSDLYPAVASKVPAQESTAWLQGSDAQLELFQPRPGQKQPVAIGSGKSALGYPSNNETGPVKDRTSEAPSTVQSPAADSAPAISASPAPKSVETPYPRPSFSSKTAPVNTGVIGGNSAAFTVTSSPSPVTLPATSSQYSTRQGSTTGQTAPPASKRVTSTATMAEAKTAADGRFNPGWSRKFLLGKTPLKPDYHDVHGLSATMSANAQMFKANRLFMYFPLAGPGGRLGVHPVALKGRLPVQIPALAVGAIIVDFELDPFDETKVYIASDDSKIRVFSSAREGFEGDRSDSSSVLSDPKMDRIIELKHHPAAETLLLSVSDDHGKSTIRLWDTATGAVVTVPLPAGGIWSSAWSPDGNLLALATKSKQILLLDPRRPDSLVSCSSHESTRPISIAWASPNHLLTTGFTRAASREMILYSAQLDNLKPIGRETLDVSPAPLFPFVDIDTNIAILYSRGERSCQAYEVQPGQAKAFAKLPNFETGTLQAGWAFLNKQGNDVRQVEILSALRLTQSTIEQVSFTVPRAKAECFQDDIFVSTRNVEKPTLSTQEWLDGKDAPLELIDLKPADMKRLSEAPAPPPKVSTRNQIGEITMTDSQKQEAYMDRLFKAAKEDGDEEEVVRSSHAPEDDDW